MERSASRLLGSLAVFASAFCFYLSTVAIRFSKELVLIDPSFFAFVRFVIGFVVVCIIMVSLRQPPRPRNYHLLVGRTLANCVAVHCFYMAAKETTAAEANVLNMTYWSAARNLSIGTVVMDGLEVFSADGKPCNVVVLIQFLGNIPNHIFDKFRI
jgi:uncharacterized membrane protein